MEPLTIEIPMEVPYAISPNRTGHGSNPQAIRRMRGEWATAWHYAALEAMGAERTERPLFAGPVRIAVTRHKPARAKNWDTDNLIAACKHGADALKMAGVWRDDSQVVGWEVEQVKAADGIGRTTVVVAPVGTAE